MERGIPRGAGARRFLAGGSEASPGSRLVFYSDGITEAENSVDEEYGWARLKEHFLRSDASGSSNLLEPHVRSFAHGSGYYATVILVKG